MCHHRLQCMTRTLCTTTREYLEAVPVFGLAGHYTNFSADVSVSQKIIVCKGRQPHDVLLTPVCGTRNSPDPHLYPKEGKLVLLVLLMQLVLIPRL